MRWLLLLALLVLPGIAEAQSDTRKVLILRGDGSRFGTEKSSGSSAHSDHVNTVSYLRDVRIALENMGVPYDQITVEDSASWPWRIGGGGTGGPDSTGIKNANYMFMVATTFIMRSNENAFYLKAFQEGSGDDGAAEAGPFDGDWSTPILVFHRNMESTNIAGQLDMGLHDATGAGVDVFTDGADYFPGAFANGDSIPWANNCRARLEPSMSADTEVLVWGSDSLTTGTRVKAHRYKNAYYYSWGPREAVILLGLNKLFEVVDYTPANKLTLHLTLDHIYPNDGSTPAVADSFYRYAKAEGWRYSAAIESYSTERDDPDATTNTLIKGFADDGLFAAHPHSHTIWNLSTLSDLGAYTDTANIWQQWNDLEEAIADTLGIPLARGYEKTVALPADFIKLHQAYGFPQAGYTDIRAINVADSIGVTSLLQNGRLGQVRARRPHLKRDPKNGNRFYVHTTDSHPASDRRLYAMVATDACTNCPAADSLNWGRPARHLSKQIATALYSEDFYFHPEDNLHTDFYMSIFARRLVYYMNRTKRVLQISPAYQTLKPTRHFNAAASAHTQGP